MSELFMNMQRRRRRNAEPRSSASSSLRSARAPTPGRLTASPTHGVPNRIFDIPQDEADVAAEQEDNDPLANVLSLKLKKPDHWKWELTTSKSCSNIALPRILLYDHKGKLLVDVPAGGDGSMHEQVYKQESQEKPAKKRPYAHKRSVTTNLTHSVRQALEQEFNGLCIQEVSTPPSLTTTLSSAATQSSLPSNRSRRKSIELNINDLENVSRRSSSAKGVRFHVKDSPDSLINIPLSLPTPPSTTTPTTSSGSSGPREKRKYRRSHSTGRSSSHSLSILERFSYQKGRLSSPESDTESQRDSSSGPRYFLSTDEAGTLLVHCDSSGSSLNPRRRRRSQKYQSSSDSMQKSPESLHSRIASPITLCTPSETSTTASSRERRKKFLPLRRNMTEGDILANKNLSESEDEAKSAEAAAQPAKQEHQQMQEDKMQQQNRMVSPPCPTLGRGCTCRQQRRYKRNETTDLNGSISAGAGMQRNGKIR